MDEDDDQPEVTAFMFPMPPELQAEMERAQDQALMAAEVRANEIKDFLGSLSPDHLATFRSIMHVMVTHEQPDAVAAYYEGQASAILTFVHNKCSHCGEEHDSITEVLEPPTEDEFDDGSDPWGGPN